MKDQLDEYKKNIKETEVSATPTKATDLRQNSCKPNRDLSDRVSESLSNGKNHKNLPQKLTSAERRRKASEKMRFVSRSSSIDRVIWEPEFNKENNRVVPIRSSVGLDDKSANKREYRNAELGMEYLQLKRELALALPLNSNSVLLRQKNAKSAKNPKDRVDERSYSPVSKKAQQDFPDKPKEPAKKLVELQKK